VTAEAPVRKYTLLEKVFGPRVSDDDIVNLEIRAVTEGWFEVMEVMLARLRTRRSERFFLAGLRDGWIEIDIYEVTLVGDDVYQDDNPYEGMGER
jgi:hypothetical protein